MIERDLRNCVESERGQCSSCPLPGLELLFKTKTEFDNVINIVTKLANMHFKMEARRKGVQLIRCFSCQDNHVFKMWKFEPVSAICGYYRHSNCPSDYLSRNSQYQNDNCIPPDYAYYIICCGNHPAFVKKCKVFGRI